MSDTSIPLLDVSGAPSAIGETDGETFRALAQFHTGLTQLADDLVHAVTSSDHLENLLSGSLRSG
jgi:hypothetical protein